MVDKTKSEKNGKSKQKDTGTDCDQLPRVGGLTASLDALAPGSKKQKDKGVENPEKNPEKNVANNAAKSTDGEIHHLSSRKDKERDETARSAKKLAHKWDQTPANDHNAEGEKHNNKPENAQKAEDLDANSEPEKETETLGVVELFGALKSDIDSLRKDNEEFKTQLMSSPLSRGASGDGPQDDSGDMRALLEALKADIGNLRDENETLRTAAIMAQDRQSAGHEGEEDEQLFAMLGELKDDITVLRSENEALKHGTTVPSVTRSSSKNDEVAMMLHELKDDINELKHDNESLRLENLTARDGAHFESLGGQNEAYRNRQNGVFSNLLKGLGALALVAGAAGGGYYLAMTQGLVSGLPEQRQIALAPAAKVMVAKPVKMALPTSRKSQSTRQPVKAPVIARAPAKPVASTPVALAKPPVGAIGVSDDVPERHAGAGRWSVAGPRSWCGAHGLCLSGPVRAVPGR